MLTPEYLETMPDAMVALWQQVEDDILLDIARRIAQADEADLLTPSAIWQAWRYEQTRAVQQDVVNTLARYSGKNKDLIRQLLLDAGLQTLAADDAQYRAAGLSPSDVQTNAALNNLLDAGYRQTLGTWQNLTATTAGTVAGAFAQRMDRAWLQVSSGAFDYNTAIKRAVDDLADQMPGVTYPSGHRDTLEVAARRAILTGVNQTAAKLQLARAEEMGCEFVEVTAHEGARPEHALWQGKVYHIGGAILYEGIWYEDFETATGYGTGPGLCGWNCRHNFYPFFPGVSVRSYTQDKLDALNAREIGYNGRLYTWYEITQMQRELERRVRKYKRRYLAEQAAGQDTTATAVRLRDARRALNDFIQATGGKVDGARTSVTGFGYPEGRQTNKQVKVQNRLDAANTDLNQLRQDGIIKSKGAMALPPAAPDTLIFEREHVFQRIMERQMKFTDADRIITNARFALRQQNGGLYAYYSDEGFVAVRSDGTIFSMGRLDEGGQKMMEVARKYGF